MGRTTLSFRIAESQEMSRWKTFRRCLPRMDRPVFDAMLNTSRLYASASSSAVRTSRFEGMTMALIFNHFKVLRESAEVLDKLQRELGR